jgi:hypothetical protein
MEYIVAAQAVAELAIPAAIDAIVALAIGPAVVAVAETLAGRKVDNCP